jgi:hypothetical protein
MAKTKLGFLHVANLETTAEEFPGVIAMEM